MKNMMMKQSMIDTLERIIFYYAIPLPQEHCIYDSHFNGELSPLPGLHFLHYCKTDWTIEREEVTEWWSQKDIKKLHRNRQVELDIDIWMPKWSWWWWLRYFCIVVCESLTLSDWQINLQQIKVCFYNLHSLSCYVDDANDVFPGI